MPHGNPSVQGSLWEETEVMKLPQSISFVGVAKSSLASACKTLAT